MFKAFCLKIALIASLCLNILILLVVIHGANHQEIKKLIFHDSKLLFRRNYNCPKDSFNLAFFGQSNSANHIPGRRRISTDGIYMYNYTNGTCYVYSEPIIGASGGVNGNVMTDLALQLRRELNKPIVVIAFGESGSSIFDWQYGKYRGKLEQILKSGSQLSGGIKFFLWHQGETDAIQKVSKEHISIRLQKLSSDLRKISRKQVWGQYCYKMR